MSIERTQNATRSINYIKIFHTPDGYGPSGPEDVPPKIRVPHSKSGNYSELEAPANDVQHYKPRPALRRHRPASQRGREAPCQWNYMGIPPSYQLSKPDARPGKALRLLDDTEKQGQNPTRRIGENYRLLPAGKLLQFRLTASTSTVRNIIFAPTGLSDLLAAETTLAVNARGRRQRAESPGNVRDL